MTDFVRWDNGDLILLCHLQPGARHSEFTGMHGDRVKIRLNAPPVDGKANALLITFLSKAFGVAKNAIHIESGELSRQKRVRISTPKQLPDLPEFAHLSL